MSSLVWVAGLCPLGFFGDSSFGKFCATLVLSCIATVKATLRFAELGEAVSAVAAALEALWFLSQLPLLVHCLCGAGGFWAGPALEVLLCTVKSFFIW